MSDLVVIGIDTPRISTIAMNDFVNKALAKGSIITVAQSSPEPTHIVSNTIGINAVDQKYTPETVHLITPVNNIASKIFSDQLPISKKSFK